VNTTVMLKDVERTAFAWQYVGESLGGSHCDDCHYCKHMSQSHPYGMGSATETWIECSLGDKSNDRPTECPAYAEYLEEIKCE
jgi:hypothetical protein